MKFGAMLVYEGLSDPDYLAQVGQLVEELGFDTLWLADHVVQAVDYESTYPYNASGKLAVPPEVPFPEPLVSLAYVAATTRRIRLGTAVLILPERNPVLLAKQATTLDHLSAGRLSLGVGLGWLKEEFDALGVPFDRRGARTDEYIDAMRLLWREDNPSYEGEFLAFAHVSVRPTPVQVGGVPVIIGGHTPAAAKRAAARGDGFFPFRFSINELSPLFEAVRVGASELGRQSAEIELIAPMTKENGWISKVEDLGVSQVVIPGASPIMGLESLKARLGRFAERYIDRRG